eukprot:TRINITY_DN298_c0_g4_i2.p1 TRINITY_DN298_c0_g4~~TRINITY_DN298_c0_g4_i2.p1  ORF type:complete len:113 (+),score=0.07 TRINITY_DN298_c0_g4_i2:162-500(+)
MTSQEMVNEAITHELVHAYDHCRAEVDWTNLEHHACSEVRAANLSGDCYMTRELMRGNLGNFMGQQRECVKRRAILSVKLNKKCNGEQEAKEAVEKVFERCYQDTDPFDRAP